MHSFGDRVKTNKILENNLKSKFYLLPTSSLWAIDDDGHKTTTIPTPTAIAAHTHTHTPTKKMYILPPFFPVVVVDVVK